MVAMNYDEKLFREIADFKTECLPPPLYTKGEHLAFLMKTKNKKKKENIGMICYCHDPVLHWLEITNVAVCEKYQQKGYGTILVRYVHALARQYACKQIIAITTFEARSFWKKMGFKVVEDTDKITYRIQY